MSGVFSARSINYAGPAEGLPASPPSGFVWQEGVSFWERVGSDWLGPSDVMAASLNSNLTSNNQFNDFNPLGIPLGRRMIIYSADLLLLANTAIAAGEVLIRLEARRNNSGTVVDSYVDVGTRSLNDRFSLDLLSVASFTLDNFAQSDAFSNFGIRASMPGTARNVAVRTLTLVYRLIR